VRSETVKRFVATETVGQNQTGIRWDITPISNQRSYKSMAKSIQTILKVTNVVQHTQVIFVLNSKLIAGRHRDRSPNDCSHQIETTNRQSRMERQ
jgi:hypothetical protein